MSKKACAFFIAAVLCATAFAAEETHPLNPAEQPLAVVRMQNASNLSRLLETRQARAFGLDERDFSGSVPGPDIRMKSLREFVQYLENNDATDVWYCVTQRGSSLTRQTGGLGWSVSSPFMEGDASRIGTELATIGFDIGKGTLATHPLASDKMAVSVCRDADTGKDLLSRDERRGAPWRTSLNGFLSNDRQDLGLWISTRPLMGMATLLSGIDFRQVLSQYRLSPPDHATLDLSAKEGDLGLTLRLHGLFSDAAWGTFFDSGRGIRSHPDSLLTVTISRPMHLLTLFGLAPAVRSLPGFDPALFVPESVTVSVWRGEGGDLHWHAVCLLPTAGGIEQYRRAERLLESLAAAPGVVSIDKMPTPHGGQALRLRSGDLSVVAMAVDGRQRKPALEASFFLLAGDVADLPRPEAIEILPGSFHIASWELRPDPIARKEAAELLAGLARSELGKEYVPAFFESLMAESETGFVNQLLDTLTVSTEKGLTPLLIPAFMEEAEKIALSTTPRSERLMQRRLRFLLDIASQSRFRNLDLAAAEARAWPDQWRDVLDENGGGRRWLDAAFGGFPGDRRQVSAAVDALAGDGNIDGIAYRIVRDGGSWFIFAEADGKELYSLDSTGVMRRREGDGWIEYWESIADLW